MRNHRTTGKNVCSMARGLVGCVSLSLFFSIYAAAYLHLHHLVFFSHITTKRYILSDMHAKTKKGNIDSKFFYASITDNNSYNDDNNKLLGIYMRYRTIGQHLHQNVLLR